MNVGFVGLGNLGFPIAVAIRRAGFEVMGYDLDPKKMSRSSHLVREAGAGSDGFDFRSNPLDYGSLDEVVEFAEIIFVCVQTPHEPEYEGITPMPTIRKDFNYDHLEKALSQVCDAIEFSRKRGAEIRPRTIVVISTVLPGTTRYLVHKIGGLPANTGLVYNPCLCAMGSVLKDYLKPELVILGTAFARSLDDPNVDRVNAFYSQLFRHHRPAQPKRCWLSFESAELAKVSYNTYISAKLAIANVLGEICTYIPGANVDEVSSVLELATRRVSGPAYLRAGLGDGGACHPRDNIAMSWLAQRLNIHYDIFEAVMKARESHAKMLANLCMTYLQSPTDWILILGYAYKPEVNLTTGSHTLLLIHELKSLTSNFRARDPQFEGDVGLEDDLKYHKVIFLGCKNPAFRTYSYQPGSIIIDPFRLLQPGDLHRSCKLISLGIGEEPDRGDA